MYRFFVEQPQIGEETITITGEDVNHIKNVLRMKVGETILVSDGEDREYICKISDFSNDEVQAKIQDIIGETRELPTEVTLFQALPKGDKMETIIQKMVEKKAESKVRRWNAIAESAAKQSKRGIIPKVLMPVSFAQALDRAKNMDMVLIPYEEAENMSVTREVFSEIKPGMKIGIFIGPEGGFAESEVEEAKKIGARAITLGRRILRTETAGMATMSVLMYLMEE